MSTLSESLRRVEEQLTEKLNQLGVDWQKFTTQQAEDLGAFQEKQQAEFADKQIELQKADVEARKVAEEEKQRIIDKFDKIQAELLAKERAAQDAELVEQSEEKLLADEMKDMTAKSIASKFRKSQIIRVAEYLKLDASGLELGIAERIVKALEV